MANAMRPIDRFHAQTERQKLMRRISQAQEAARGHLAQGDKAQAAEWDAVADEARVDLRALSADLPE